MYSKILNNTRLLKSEFVGDPSILEVHVFTTDQFTGTVHESSEMKPQWAETTNILFDEMWPDNKY
jgi:8-oxo-dGTP diphosphatase/2-hydroxy-dATP diphosphatase